MTKANDDATALWNVGELARDEKEEWDSHDFYLSSPSCDENKCEATLVWDRPTISFSAPVKWASKSSWSLTDGDKAESFSGSGTLTPTLAVASACDTTASKCAKPSAHDTANLDSAWDLTV